MSRYEIACSITFLCPACGKELPPGSFMTECAPAMYRDNPLARTDRRVFITPCPDCFEFKQKSEGNNHD